MKNDGDPYNTGNVLSKEDFDHLLRIVKKRIIMLYEEMISGRIDIRPVRFKGSSPCKYCHTTPSAASTRAAGKKITITSMLSATKI